MSNSTTDAPTHTAPRPGARAGRLLAAHSVLVYLFLYAPIAVLAALSFNAGMQVSLWRGFSFRWYRALVTDPEVRDGAVNSLLIAGLATVAATVVGTMAAIVLARWDPGRSRRAASALAATRGLLYLPLIVPEIILGVALLTG